MALLEVENLQTHFGTPDGVVRAVEGLSFHIDAGETLGDRRRIRLRQIGDLDVDPAADPGAARQDRRQHPLRRPRSAGRCPKQEMRGIRGNAISMIFQEPMTSLNPVLTVGRQIGETVRLHQGMYARDAEAKAVEMLTLVGIPAPARRVREYPHQLSGGMRQRVMIAMALACNPKLLIADEPTTALDVTIQAQILDLMRDLKTRAGLGDHADHARSGRGRGNGPAGRGHVRRAQGRGSLGQRNLRAIRCIPTRAGCWARCRKLGPRWTKGGRTKLAEIAGLVPSLRKPIVGCAFAGRCSDGDRSVPRGGAGDRAQSGRTQRRLSLCRTDMAA